MRACLRRPTTMPTMRYDAVSRFTHWVTALIIMVAMVVGLCFPLMQDEAMFQFFSTLNKSLGTLLLPVMVVRAVWRCLRHEPAYPETFSRWNQRTARLFHVGMYLVILCTSASGLLMLKTGFFWFGLVYLPPPLKNLELNYQFAELHSVCIRLLLGMTLLHMGAVVLHCLRGRRAILHRMLPAVR